MPRVVLTFDGSSLESLENVKRTGQFRSLGAAVRDCVQTLEAIQGQALEGFSEILVRNNRTHQEKEIVVSSIRRMVKMRKGGK